MKITWIGHSCFKIEKRGYAVVIDPYEDGYVPGLLPVHESAAQVLCTHDHSDHNARQTVTIEDEGENPFTLTRIHTFHDEVGGAKRGHTEIFILDDGENRVAHLGDLGCDLEEDQMNQLKGLDVLLIPVGGFYTIDAAQAADLVKALQPRITIPMHFRDDAAGFGFDVIGTVDEFTKRMDQVCVLEDSSMETSDRQQARVVVLKPQNSKR